MVFCDVLEKEHENNLTFSCWDLFSRFIHCCFVCPIINISCCYIWKLLTNYRFVYELQIILNYCFSWLKLINVSQLSWFMIKSFKNTSPRSGWHQVCKFNIIYETCAFILITETIKWETSFQNILDFNIPAISTVTNNTVYKVSLILTPHKCSFSLQQLKHSLDFMGMRCLSFNQIWQNDKIMSFYIPKKNGISWL